MCVVLAGELLRKKRREKGGHKDPLLQEISLLQDDIMAQISNLRKEHEAAEKKRTEIDKVAQILGLSPSDRPPGASREQQQEDTAAPPPPKKKKSPEGPQEAASATTKVQTPAEEPGAESRASEALDQHGATTPAPVAVSGVSIVSLPR